VADEVLIAGSDKRAKIRHPWAVVGLTIITLGIYGIFWWYYINRELRDLGRARNVSGLGDSPGVSCAAFALGGWAFYIPLIWTIVTTSIRVQRGQRVALGGETLNGWIAGLLWVFTLGIGGVVYTQSQLNRVWEEEPVLSPFGPVGATPDLDRLEKLTSLKESGAISQEEFDAEKAKLMPQPQATQSTPASQPPPTPAPESAQPPESPGTPPPQS
jgi:hypothetical protein